MIATCLVVCTICGAQDPYHIRYTLEDGLPSEEVYDIEQDKDGRIWVATDRGVASYDGYSFTSFDKSDGLAHNTIFEIFRDNDHRLWFSAYDGSLTYYENNKFVVPEELNRALKDFAPSQWLRKLQQIGDDTFLFSYSQISSRDKRGYYTFDFSSSKIEEFEFNEPLGEEGIIDFYPKHGIAKVHSNDFPIKESWAVGDNGLLYVINENSFNIPSENFRSYNYDPGPSILSWIEDQEVIYRTELDMTIESILLHENKIFLATWQGLKVIEHPHSKATITTTYADNIVTALKIDRESNLWISTQDAGLIFIPNLLRVKTYPSPPNSSPTNLTVFKDHLFLGYMNDSYMRAIDKNLATVFELKNNNTTFYPYLTVAKDKAYTSGLSTIEYKNGFRFRDKHNIADWATGSLYRSAVKLSSGNILTGNRNIRLVNEDLALSNYAERKNIYALYQCINDKVLVGNLEGADIYSDFDESKFEQLAPSPIPLGSRVNDIIGLNDSLVIFASLGKGLVIFNCNSESAVAAIDKDDGLLSNQVNTCFVDSIGSIWAGTNFGLNKIDLNIQERFRIESVESYTTLDGLSSNFIMDIEYWNEELWVACKGGINHFKTEDLVRDPIAPKVIIDSLLVLDKLLDSDNPQLEHNENDISIYYTGITFNKPKQEATYRYKLTKDEKEQDFRFTKNRNLRFGNLEPGSYNFIVQTKNDKNIWSEINAPVEFTIKPHISSTLLFRLSMIFLLLLCLYLFYKFREKQLLEIAKQKQDLKEAELRSKISELDALRNQMNPHFIYNSLNSIQNFIFKNDPEKANYLLSRFSKLIRSSLNLSKLENITLEEEIEFLENYLELEQMRFQDKFDFEIVTAPDLSNQIKVPPLLVQPLIENAVKHGFRKVKAAGIIRIRFQKEHDYLIITVEDNGIGYNDKPQEERRRKGPNALEIIKERIDIINSVTNTDSHFKISAIVVAEQIKGTIAELRIPYLK